MAENIYPYPENLPSDLRELWDFLGEVHQGDNKKFMERLKKFLDYAMPHRDDVTWAQLFPEGRTIFYEGDDPEGFRQTIKAEFGFDPAERPGCWVEGKEMLWDDSLSGHPFHCPAEHLDAIYASGRWPMGS